jgi:hypothetical protein
VNPSVREERATNIKAKEPPSINAAIKLVATIRTALKIFFFLSPKIIPTKGFLFLYSFLFTSHVLLLRGIKKPLCKFPLHHKIPLKQLRP